MNKKRFKQTKEKQKEKTPSYENDIILKKPSNNQNRKIKLQNSGGSIKKIEYPYFVCAKCGLQINELNSAIGDKETGKPIHFKCAMNFLKKSEDLKEKEDIIYIGNGNFAIAYFENPKVRKDFKIIKLIQWEDKNKDYSWKSEIADLASKV